MDHYTEIMLVDDDDVIHSFKEHRKINDERVFVFNLLKNDSITPPREKMKHKRSCLRCIIT
jgi:hypothetical protein